MEETFLYNAGGLSLPYFKSLIASNVWKAFAIIHAGIHHQMRIILTYHGGKIRKSSNDHAKRWKLITEKKFGKCIDDLYIIEAIDEDLYSKLKDFNAKRNRELGHINLYERKEEPKDEDIKKHCIQGVEIAKLLDGVIRNCLFSEPPQRTKEVV